MSLPAIPNGQIVGMLIHILDWRRGLESARMGPVHRRSPMATASAAPIPGPRNASDIARSLGPELARRAKLETDEDAYVSDNIALLKQAGLVEAAVPRELGGMGAEIGDLAAMLRMLSYHCGSTGLAFSMHT